MPPRDPILDRLWAEVGIYRPNGQMRDPALTAAQTMQRPRPMPRQMRPAAARANDPNSGVRRQATREMEMRQAFNPQQEAYAPPRNQFAEAGGMALEATGLPSIRRGTANVARGAINADPMQGLRQTGAGAFELGMGGLGVASWGVGARGARPAPRAPQIAPEPMPRMTPPPREIAPNGMTIRPPAPFRQSFVGGSEDLADAARPQLWRGSDAGGSRGGWATPDRQAASEYGANVRPVSGDASNALEVRDFGDIELAIGDDPAAQRALGYLNDGNADVWDALELPEVQAALRARGHGAVRLADDVSPTGRRHESVLFLRGRPPGIAPRTGGERLNWLGNDRLIRNPTEADLTRLSELGDEMKYVMDTDGNVYAFSAADAHHNTAMRALRDNGVQVRSLGPGSEVTDPDAAGFIWRNKDGSFAHENANMVESGPYSSFAQRVRPNGQATRAPGIAPQQAPPRTSPRLFPSPNTPRTRPQAPAGTGDMQPRGITAEFRIRPPKRLWRGVMPNIDDPERIGRGTFRMGRGLYSSTDRAVAKGYATNPRSGKVEGEVLELTPEQAFPRNPVVINPRVMDVTDWFLEKSGERNIREFNKKWPDPGDFVRAQGYDGIIFGDEIVRYIDGD